LNNREENKRELKDPEMPLTKLALNPKVQGGDTCGFLGFPSGGHAHQTQRDTAGLTFIGSRTLLDCKHSRAWRQYNPELPVIRK